MEAIALETVRSPLRVKSGNSRSYSIPSSARATIRRRDCKPSALAVFEVDHLFELDGLLDAEVGALSTLGIRSRRWPRAELSSLVPTRRPETAGFHILLEAVACRQLVKLLQGQKFLLSAK